MGFHCKTKQNEKVCILFQKKMKHIYQIKLIDAKNFKKMCFVYGSLYLFVSNSYILF